ncbi:MAG: peptidylprolyl isomerase [Pseudomonadota bacterium]
METSAGAIEFDVYPGKAPVTANNFLAYVDGGHYDGGAFYRTVRPDNDNNPLTISVIQGGMQIIGAEDTNPEPPFPPIAHESTDITGLSHADGALSMARFMPGTAQSEFFISIGDNPVLDHGGERFEDRLGFAVFGQVTAGMDVVTRIHSSEADAPTDIAYIEGQILTTPVRIVSLRRMQ